MYKIHRRSQSRALNKRSKLVQFKSTRMLHGLIQMLQFRWTRSALFCVFTFCLSVVCSHACKKKKFMKHSGKSEVTCVIKGDHVLLYSQKISTYPYSGLNELYWLTLLVLGEFIRFSDTDKDVKLYMYCSLYLRKQRDLLLFQGSLLWRCFRTGLSESPRRTSSCYPEPPLCSHSELSCIVVSLPLRMSRQKSFVCVWVWFHTCTHVRHAHCEPLTQATDSHQGGE